MDLITQTQWADYSHAYGPATDLPPILRDLISDDRELVEIAITNLHATICHQGTVYSATAPVVPILYSALENDENNRVQIAFLIACIANGNGYYSREHEILEPLYDIWRQTLAGQGTTLEQVRQQESVYINSIRDAIGDGFAQLPPFIQSDDADVREEIVLAINKFTEHFETSMPCLKRQLVVESNHKIRRMIENSIAQLEDST